MMSLRVPNALALSAALLLSVALSGSAAADYNDTVVLKNGDRITGTVKSLVQGQLRFDTDAMGTVSIEWDKVDKILSETPMQVEVVGGARYFGELDRPPRDDEVSIKTDQAVKNIAMTRVIHVTPIEHSVWKRIQGSLSAGLNFTKSSDVTQLSVSGNALYRARLNQLGLDYNHIITDQESGTTAQLDARLVYRHFLKRRWFGTGFVSFQRNQTLGIDGRALAGAGAGHSLVETDRSTLALSVGLDLNVENTAIGRDTSGELFAALDYALFKYTGDQSNWAVSLAVFPNLTESGRVRWQINTRWRQELFNNFFWDFTLYGTGDNEPPPGALADIDYGVITSLGWTFGP